ncbi:MAG: hypothetical protein AB1611_12705 [bacterium]
MRSKTGVNFKIFTRRAAVILGCMALVISLSSICLAQLAAEAVLDSSSADVSSLSASQTDTSLYWYPDLVSWSWYYDPDLDVHIGKFYKLPSGVVFPVTVHNHWYGEATNVNLEVYAQKRWCACLNRPPSARLAEIPFKSVPPGGSKTTWVWWNHEPVGGCSLYAQVDSGDLFTSVAGGAVSPFFRKNDHSAAGIRITPDGDAAAYWPLIDPYGIAVDMVRNPNFLCGQNYERNEKNNWDYFQRYDLVAQPGQPVLVPLPIINPIPDSTFSGTLTLVADSVDRQMLDAVSLGRLRTAAVTTAAAAATKDSFTPSTNNALDFNLSYNKDKPENEFPAAIQVTPGKTKGTTDFKILMSIDPQPGSSEDQAGTAVEINVFVDIK